MPFSVITLHVFLHYDKDPSNSNRQMKGRGGDGNACPLVLHHHEELQEEPGTLAQHSVHTAREDNTMQYSSAHETAEQGTHS